MLDSMLARYVRGGDSEMPLGRPPASNDSLPASVHAFPSDRSSAVE